MNRLHPYSLVFGIGIGFVVLAALRHPLFALFAGVGSVVLIDFAIKASNKKNDEE